MIRQSTPGSQQPVDCSAAAGDGAPWLLLGWHSQLVRASTRLRGCKFGGAIRGQSKFGNLAVS
jgi:hypothetical protein